MVFDHIKNSIVNLKMDFHINLYLTFKGLGKKCQLSSELEKNTWRNICIDPRSPQEPACSFVSLTSHYGGIF